MDWTVVGGFVVVAVGLFACASLLAAGLWRMTHPKGEGDDDDPAYGEWSDFALAQAARDPAAAGVVRRASRPGSRDQNLRTMDQVTRRERMKNILQ